VSAINPGSDLYIDVPLDTDPQDLLNECYTYLASVIPGWAPAQGNLDVWLLMAIASLAAETRDVASLVPQDIFRWFGANLVNIPPIDEAEAIGHTTWHMVDTNGYTIPAGTQVEIPVAGQSPVPFITTFDTVVAPGSSVVAGVEIQAVNPGAAANDLGSIGGAVTLLDTLTFVSSVTQDDVPTGGVDAELDSDYLDRLAAELQLLAPRPILARDYAIYSRNVAGVYRAAAQDLYTPYHNMLTANDASVETSIGDWVADVNCAVAWDATFGVDGTHSVKMTSTAAGDMTAVLAAAGEVAVVAGDEYTVIAEVRPASARNCSVGMRWYDGTHTLISTTYGADVAVGAGVTAQVTADLNAPATAAYGRQVLRVKATGAGGEVANWDEMGIRHGNTDTLDWVPGGTSETNSPRTVTVAATDINGNPIDAATKTALDNYLQSAREVNFLVYVVDPVVSLIDVTVHVKAQPNWDTTLVQTNVTDALTSFLNKLTWGTFPGQHNPQDWNNTQVLRYNALLAVVGEAAGVAYVESLTFGVNGLGAQGSVDLTLPGIFPLPSANVLAVTVDA
jgi:Baseplate J-like protein